MRRKTKIKADKNPDSYRDVLICPIRVIRVLLNLLFYNLIMRHLLPIKNAQQINLIYFVM